MLRLLDTFAGDSVATRGAGVFPPVNITQDADHFYVRAEIPGIKPDQLVLSAVRNQVSLAGEREIAREQERVSYHRRERAAGSFNRTVTLPSEIDTQRIDASYADGILTLKLPKAEETKPRQITVRT
jgi:HSP20 family protein